MNEIMIGFGGTSSSSAKNEGRRISRCVPTILVAETSHARGKNHEFEEWPVVFVVMLYL